MATEQTITISGTPTVVSGVTVPYANTSDLEVYIGKGKVESIEVTNAGAGYTNITFTGSAGTNNTTNSVPLVFSGGGGSAPTVRATVTSNQIDNKFWTDANGTEFTGSGGSGYTAAPNISISGLSGGTGGELTAKIYAKKTSGTDYTLSGTSGNTTITFTSALANGDKVLIKRATGVSTAANTFAAGSAITAEALNKSFDQIRYKVEELPNVTSTALTNGDKGDINVSGSTWTIDNNTITEAKIGNLQVTAGKIAGDAINGDKIADDSINSEHYVDGSIDTAHIANSQITFAKIENIPQDRVIGRTASGTGVTSAIQVDTDIIADDAVTYAKMQHTSTANRVLGAVSAGTIGETEVVQAMLQDQAVNEAKLQIGNSPSNDLFLQAQSGQTGGLLWANPFNMAGAGPNVVHQSVAANTTGGFNGETILTINITPQRTASKVLILFSGISSGGSDSDGSTSHIFKLFKGSDQIGSDMTGAGATISYPTQIILNSPNTDSQVTYYVKHYRSNTDSNVTTRAGTSITLMEIK